MKMGNEQSNEKDEEKEEDTPKKEHGLMGTIRQKLSKKANKGNEDDENHNSNNNDIENNNNEEVIPDLMVAKADVCAPPVLVCKRFIYTRAHFTFA